MDDNKPSQVTQESNAWMNGSDYKKFKTLQAAELRNARRTSTLIRIFFILLAVGGLLVATAFIGSLIAPTETYVGRGQNCVSSAFDSTKLLLNFLGYTLLFITGIVGVIIPKATTKTLGILLIILAPLVGIGIALVDLGNALCGV